MSRESDKCGPQSQRLSVWQEPQIDADKAEEKSKSDGLLILTGCMRR